MTDTNATRPIRAGDVVDILYTDNEQNLTAVRVVYVPQSDGDYWHVSCGSHHYEINPRNSALKGLRHYRPNRPPIEELVAVKNLSPATAPASADGDREEAA